MGVNLIDASATISNRQSLTKTRNVLFDLKALFCLFVLLYQQQPLYQIFSFYQY